MNRVAGSSLITEESLRRTITERDRQLDNPYSKDTQITFIRGHRNYRGDKLIRVASPHKFLDPANGPLIAVRLNILSRKTLGGLHTDLDARVLQPSGEPLPGRLRGRRGGRLRRRRRARLQRPRGHLPRRLHLLRSYGGPGGRRCDRLTSTRGRGMSTCRDGTRTSKCRRSACSAYIACPADEFLGTGGRRSRLGRMSGKVVHFEIPFDDGDRARKFYSEAFGWTINEIPDLHYSIVQTGPTGEGGFPTDVGYIGGGMLKRESPADRPVITVDVEDIDEALKRIEELGGMTVLGRQDVGDMGWAAYFKDVEGNLMGLWQSRQG